MVLLGHPSPTLAPFVDLFWHDDRYRSTTGKMTTDFGHRQRAVASTHPTPITVDTRLRMVGSFSPS
jgi:hypothetical protein